MAGREKKGEIFDIADIRAPVLSDIQRMALAGAAQASFDFSSDAILSAA